MTSRLRSPADKSSTDRQESWKKIFRGFLALLEDQQRQLGSFAKERKFLEKRIQIQHERWLSDVKLLEDEINQLERESKFKDMRGSMEVAKANLIVGLKQKEALMFKYKFEDADDERKDLKLLFEELSQCLAEPKRLTRSNSKDPEAVALKAERDFAWNQYKKTDTELREQIKCKESEVEAANGKVGKLISELEQSQSSNMEKDRIISALQENMATLESDSKKKTEEISRLSKELELLRSNSVAPVLRRCMVEAGTSHLGDKNTHLKGTANSTKDLDQLLVPEKRHTRSSKRKASESDLTPEKPRLFSSKFKVPKLKLT